MPPDSPINLGRYDDRQELRKGFFDAVRAKKKEGILDPGIPLSGPDLLSALRQTFESEFTNEKSKGLFGFFKKDKDIVVSYGGEEIGFFPDTDKGRQKLIMLVQELYKAGIDESNQEALQQSEIEAVTALTKLELAQIVTTDDMNIVLATKGAPGDASRRGEMKMRNAYDKGEDQQRRVNNMSKKKVVEHEEYTLERAKAGMLKLQDGKFAVETSIYNQNMQLYDQLIQKANSGQVGREGRDYIAVFEGDLIRDLAATYVQMEETKMPLGVFAEKKVEFDREAKKLMQNFGLEKKGRFMRIGGSVLKDPRFKLAVEEFKLGRDMNRGLSSEKKGWKGLYNIADGTNEKKIVKLRKARSDAGALSSHEAMQKAYAVLTDHAGTIINPYDDLKKYGYDGSVGYEEPEPKDPLLDKPEAATIYSVSGSGTATETHKVVDLSTASIEELVAGYIDAEQAALSTNQAIRGFSEAKKFGYAIIDEVFMHPSNGALVYGKLGGDGGVAAGQEKFLTIMKHLFFNDKKTQQAVVSKYRYRRNRLDYKLKPDQSDPFHFDFSAEDMTDEMLRVLAFTQTLQEKVGGELSHFKRGSRNREQMQLTYEMQVIEFRKHLGMGVPDAANYVRTNIDQVDQNKDTPILATGNGLTKSGGMIDHLTMAGAGWAARSDMPGVAQVIVGAGEVVKVGVHVVEKGALIVAGWRGVKAIFRAGKELFKGNFSQAGTELREGVVGKKVVQTDSGYNVFTREDGMLNPLILAGAIQAADNRLLGGNTMLGNALVDVGAAFGIPAAERAKERRDQITAMHDIAESMEQVTTKTIGNIPLSELPVVIKPQGQGIVVDLSVISKEKKQERGLDKWSQRDLDRIELGLGRFLMDENGMTSATFAILVEKYGPSGVTLNTLLDRYDAHKEPLDTVKGLINDENIMGKDTYHLLRYAENNEYEAKMKQLVFVGQQIGKLDDVANGSLLGSYIGNHPEFMSATINSGTPMTPKDFLSNLVTLKDSAGQSVIGRAKNNFFKQIVDLPYDATVGPGGTDANLQNLIEGYYSVLATALDHRVDATNTPFTPEYTDAAGAVQQMPSGWTYDVDGAGTDLFPISMAGFFHDPAITGGNIITGPTLGGLSGSSGSWTGDHVDPGSVSTSSWAIPSDIFATTWDDIGGF